MIRLPIRLGVLAHLYRVRLAVHPLQELLALIGVATGVALLFAVLVANSSATESVRELARGLTGKATVEIAARGAFGMDQRILGRVDRLGPVLSAAPLLEERGQVVGPEGKETIELIGADPMLVAMHGAVLRNFHGVQLKNALALPAGVASTIGARPGDSLLVRIGGRPRRVQAGPILGSDQIDALSESPFAVGSLSYVQQLTGMQGRITRVLVAPIPARSAALKSDLRQIAGSTLDVRPVDIEARLVEDAASPNNESTAMFAAISSIVGMLLAFNAMLLTAPERRRFVSILRLQGFTRGGVLAVLTFDALALGLVASLLGLLLGDLLSRSLFEVVPGYLEFAFPVGTQRIVTVPTAALAFGVGIGATLIATARPVLDLYSRRPVDAALGNQPSPTRWRGSTIRRLLLLTGVGLVGATTLSVQLAPETTIVGVGGLVLAMTLTIPVLLDGALSTANAISYRLRRGGGLLGISICELRATATRSTALVATTAIAVFGCVALEGSRQDLLRGLDQNFAGNLQTADLLVTPGGEDNLLNTEPFRTPRALSRPNPSIHVRAVRAFQAGLLDLSDRRVWVVARPSNERTMIAPGELVSGNLADTTQRLRDGGWAAVSSGIARERHLHIGQKFSLPAPTGTLTVKLAATISNLGWPPGAIVINTADYQRAWATNEPTELELDITRMVSPGAAKRAVQGSLGPNSGLTVQTAAERVSDARRVARRGLSRLTQITILVLLAAIAAAAAAIIATLWLRRPRLAALRAQGFERPHIWRGLLIEAGLLVTTGSILGAGFGLYGQLLLTRWLRLSTGFPAPYSVAGPLALTILALIAITTLIVAAILGYRATQVSPSLSFQD